MGEKEKQNVSCAVERGGTGDVTVVRNKLLYVPWDDPETMSCAVCATTKGHVDVCCLGHHPNPCWYPRAIMTWMDCAAIWRLGDLWPVLHPRATWKYVVLPQQGATLMSMTCVTTKSHVDVYGLGYNLKPRWCPKVMSRCPCSSPATGQLYLPLRHCTPGDFVCTREKSEPLPGSPWLRQEKEIQEKSQWRFGIDGKVEAIGLKPNQHLIAMNKHLQAKLSGEKGVLCNTPLQMSPTRKRNKLVHKHWNLIQASVTQGICDIGHLWHRASVTAMRRGSS